MCVVMWRTRRVFNFCSTKQCFKSGNCHCIAGGRADEWKRFRSQLNNSKTVGDRPYLRGSHRRGAIEWSFLYPRPPHVLPNLLSPTGGGEIPLSQIKQTVGDRRKCQDSMFKNTDTIGWMWCAAIYNRTAFAKSSNKRPYNTIDCMRSSNDLVTIVVMTLFYNPSSIKPVLWPDPVNPSSRCLHQSYSKKAQIWSVLWLDNDRTWIRWCELSNRISYFFSPN